MLRLSYPVDVSIGGNANSGALKGAIVEGIEIILSLTRTST
jgi:hypothetical protein